MPTGFEHHRRSNITVFGSGVFGNKEITTTSVELKVGEDVLTGRHTLHVINDSSLIIYIGTEPDFAIDTAIPLFSGEKISFALSPNPSDRVSRRFWAKTVYGNTWIRLMEVN